MRESTIKQHLHILTLQFFDRVDSERIGQIEALFVQVFGQLAHVRRG